MTSGELKVRRTLPIDGALLADVLLRLRRDAETSVLRWTLGERGAAEVDVHFVGDGDAWTFTGRIWNDAANTENWLALTNVRLRVEANAEDSVQLLLLSAAPATPELDALAGAVVDELAEELLWHAARAGIAAQG
jgi:hypothetical protein